MPFARSSRCLTVVDTRSASSGGRPHCRMSTRSNALLFIKKRANMPSGLLMLTPPMPSSSSPSAPSASTASTMLPPPPPPGSCTEDPPASCVAAAPGAASSPSGWCSGFALKSSSVRVSLSEIMAFMYGRQRTVKSLQDMFNVLKYLLTHMSWNKWETPLSSHLFSLKLRTVHVMFSARCAPMCMHPLAWIWLSLKSSECRQ
mmetsp:Transcript_1717/g.4892  ORF Transcript_1717/g.4892 Transcript_1717/m.4892 type:complete len:202 (-) Transcript_1717:858-1463(-)